jgi:hypothetical protein
MPATDHRAAIKKLRREALSSGPRATASGSSRPHVEENLSTSALPWPGAPATR